MYLYGASGHCKVIIDSIEASTDKIIKGVFDDNIEFVKILNAPICNFETFDKTKIHEMFISVGNNAIRKMISESIDTNSFQYFVQKQLFQNTLLSIKDLV